MVVVDDDDHSYPLLRERHSVSNEDCVVSGVAAMAMMTTIGAGMDVFDRRLRLIRLRFPSSCWILLLLLLLAALYYYCNYYDSYDHQHYQVSWIAWLSFIEFWFSLLSTRDHPVKVVQDFFGLFYWRIPGNSSTGTSTSTVCEETRVKRYIPECS